MASGSIFCPDSWHGGLSLGVVLGLAGVLMGEARVDARPRLPRVASLSEREAQAELVQGLIDGLRQTEHASIKTHGDRITAVLDRAAMRLALPKNPKASPYRIRLLIEKTVPLGGRFRSGAWSIVVDEHLLTAGSIPAVRIAKLVDILGHELRHAEHRFRMACWLADTGRSTDIGLLAVPRHIIDEALRSDRPRLDRKRTAEAKHWWAAWTAPERRKNTQALTQAEAMQTMARRRQAELLHQLDAASTRRPPAPGKEIKALRKALAEAETAEAESSREVARIHKKGEKLPLEQDCQRVGRDMARLVVRRLGN